MTARALLRITLFMLATGCGYPMTTESPSMTEGGATDVAHSDEALGCQAHSSIVGTVRDPDGEPIAGAAVQIEQLSGDPFLGLTVDATTNSAGTYCMPPIPEPPAGRYRVAVAVPGFALVDRTAIVEAEGTSKVDFFLQGE